MESPLPPEIWEGILSRLPSHEMLTAACVCRQWRHLVTRISQQRCQLLPPRLLYEIIHEYSLIHHAHRKITPDASQITPSSSNNTPYVPQITPDASQITPSSSNNTPYVPQITPSYSNNDDDDDDNDDDDIDWLEIMDMVIKTRITNKVDYCLVTRKISDVVLLTSTGRFMVLVEHGDIGCHLILFADEGQHSHTNFNGMINKVCIMEGGDDGVLIAVVVEKELQFLQVQHDPKQLIPLTVTPELNVDSRISCSGHRLVMSQLVDDYHLAIYHVQKVTHTTVTLMLQGRINTTTSPLIWDLWNGFVTVLESGGHVSCYTLSGTLIGKSRLYKDLRYPNPTVLSRGIVFASTITSRTLLCKWAEAYWHMDRDRDYWLVGESVLTGWVKRGAQSVGNTALNSPRESPMQIDDEQRNHRDNYEAASKCMLTLNKVRIGSAHFQEVSAMHYSRGILFCGTRSGDVLIYKIMDEIEPSKIKNWDKKNSNSNQPSHSLKSSSSLPSSSPSLSSSDCVKLGRLEFFSLLHISLCKSPIYRISCYFTCKGIVIAAGDKDRKCKMVTVPYLYNS